jgi:hypothetical protein
MPPENDTKDYNNSYSAHVAEGKYLFGDYTPFDENKNFLIILKDFVSLSTSIIQKHLDVEKLLFVLKNTKLLQNEVIAKIEESKSSVETSVVDFHKKYNEDLISTILPMPVANELFFKAKDSLIDQLTTAEKKYIKQSEEYEKFVQSKIIDSYKNAIALLQSWLIKDHYYFPSAVTSESLKIVKVYIDKNNNNKMYRISRTCTIMLESTRILPSETALNTAISCITYSFLINTSEIKPWNEKRRISDLGIDDILIPVGFKIPISEKLKRSFRFVSNNYDTHNPLEKEPDLIDASNYYLAQATLEGVKTLSVDLAKDPSDLDDKVIKICYNLDTLYDNEITQPASYNDLLPKDKLPRIEYIQKEGSPSINVLQKELLRFTDISKIVLLGRTLVDEMDVLLNPTSVYSNFKLESIRINNKDAIKVNNTSNDTSSQSKSLLYDEDIVISFLELIAGLFSHLIQKLREKSPVNGELILKHIIDNGERKEYVVRIEELDSQLSSTDEGKRISNILGLSNNIVPHSTKDI